MIPVRKARVVSLPYVGRSGQRADRENALELLSHIGGNVARSKITRLIRRKERQQGTCRVIVPRLRNLQLERLSSQLWTSWTSNDRLPPWRMKSYVVREPSEGNWGKNTYDNRKNCLLIIDHGGLTLFHLCTLLDKPRLGSCCCHHWPWALGPQRRRASDVVKCEEKSYRLLSEKKKKMSQGYSIYPFRRDDARAWLTI